MTAQQPVRRQRSWVDVLLDLVERVPGPPWFFYVVVSLLFGVGSIVIRWWDGSVPYGQFVPVSTAFAFGSVYCLGVVHYLNYSARRSLEQFRPALGTLEASYDRLRSDLTRMPQTTAIVALVLGIVVQLVGSSSGDWGVTGHTGLPTRVFSTVAQLLLDVFFLVFILRAARQLRLIARIHRTATDIRLFESGPHTAFSKFTLATAIAITVPYAIIEIIGAYITQVSAIEVALLVLAAVLSLILFVVPLNGMHRRLVEEKSRQVEATDRAFEGVTGRLHADIEAERYDQAVGVNKVLSSLAMESDRLRQISTWPWSAETFRGFLTSVGLPILLWLITTALGQFIAI